MCERQITPEEATKQKLKALVNSTVTTAMENNLVIAALRGIAFNDPERDERVKALQAFAEAIAIVPNVPHFNDRFHPHGVKQHTAFVARSRAAVDALHAAALKAGGRDNGKPGLRNTAEGYPPGYYAAFCLRPRWQQRRSGVSWIALNRAIACMSSYQLNAALHVPLPTRGFDPYQSLNVVDSSQ